MSEQSRAYRHSLQVDCEIASTPPSRQSLGAFRICKHDDSDEPLITFESQESSHFTRGVHIRYPLCIVIPRTFREPTCVRRICCGSWDRIMGQMSVFRRPQGTFSCPTATERINSDDQSKASVCVVDSGKVNVTLPTYARDRDNPHLKAWATKTLLRLKQHLGMAKRLI